MYQLIDELIPKLDSIKDIFLIGLLEAKKSELEDLKINILPEDVMALTSWARSETRKVIDRNPKIQKINSMLSGVFNCEICPLAIMCPAGYKSFISNSEVCYSCRDKKLSLDWKLHYLMEDENKFIDKIIATEEIVDIIKMKSIIRNINRKLKNL
jgi:hypothetical protein